MAGWRDGSPVYFKHTCGTAHARASASEGSGKSASRRARIAHGVVTQAKRVAPGLAGARGGVAMDEHQFEHPENTLNGALERFHYQVHLVGQALLQVRMVQLYV